MKCNFARSVRCACEDPQRLLEIIPNLTAFNHDAVVSGPIALPMPVGGFAGSVALDVSRGFYGREWLVAVRAARPRPRHEFPATLA